MKVQKISKKYSFDTKLNLASEIIFGEETKMIGWDDSSLINNEWDGPIQPLLEDIIVTEFQIGTSDEVDKFMRKHGIFNKDENDDSLGLVLEEFLDRYKEITVKQLLEDFEVFKSKQ